MGKRVDIIRAASQESSVLVVVSAMSGVTNKLIEAATRAEAGDRKSAAAIFEQLRNQHDEALAALISSDAERNRVRRNMQECFQEGERLCQGTMMLRALTLRRRALVLRLGGACSAVR